MTADVHPVIGIHQPNFFPWLGYFHKVRWSDTFVLLDDVQIPRRSGSVVNRIGFAQNGREVVFSASLDRSAGRDAPIDTIAFSSTENFRDKLAKLIVHAYGRARFAPTLKDKILELVRHPSQSLSVYNAHAIRTIATWLELPARFTKSSELALTTTSTQRLVDIVRALGGRTYLAGAGAKAYQEDLAFFEQGIHVWYREYVPPAYPRPDGEPLAGLSVLDALFHLGIEGTRALIDVPLDPGKRKLAAPA
ncbi:MAG TPA: WbqC family protein [Labilithrix sp.]|nr:WbqC family protein [Labilithrix sp.]